MTTYAATLYVPGKPALPLTPAQVLNLLSDVIEGMIYCHETEVKQLLQVADVDTVYCDEQCSIYGLGNAVDYDAQPNPEAEHAATCLIGEWCEFCGPILIVEKAKPNSPQPIGGGLPAVAAA
jgi:hypothetical protein